MEALLAEHGATESLRRLEKDYLRYAEKVSGQGYLARTKELFAKPLRGLGFAESLTAELRQHADEGKELGLLAGAADLLGAEFEPADFVAPKTLADLIPYLEETAAIVEAAFAAIPEAEHEQLVVATKQLLDDFVKHIYVHQRPSNKDVWQHVQRIAWRKLFQAQLRLLALRQPAVRNALRRDAIKHKMRDPKVPGVSGSLLWAQKSKAGYVVVGGASKTVYSGPLAFALDLGGDDQWSAAATRSGPKQRINVTLDLSGNDLYLGEEHFAQGCGLYGCSLLFDLAGSDRYIATRAAQGCSVAGIGMLIDAAGDDAYEGDAYLGGAGLFGYGLLLDRAGNDEQRAKLASFGFAWPLSVGQLVDLRGNDKRTATGGYGSSYGTKGAFNGLSHGVSIGFRTLANGGFGIVVDGGGNDEVRVGEFGFGCGYFFGCGIVRDFGGHDLVEASRYGIATGAHFGLGFVIDDGGDDVWKNSSAASLAGNWDLSVAGFLDRAGNDRYETKGLSLGCATISSVATFFDLGGRDSYQQSGGRSFGRAGHPQDADRKHQSVAIFVDDGGKQDRYPQLKLAKEIGNKLTRSWSIEQKATQGDKAKRLAGRGVFLDR